jgi:hypothetical protein
MSAAISSFTLLSQAAVAAGVMVDLGPYPRAQAAVLVAIEATFPACLQVVGLRQKGYLHFQRGLPTPSQ